MYHPDGSAAGGGRRRHLHSASPHGPYLKQREEPLCRLISLKRKCLHHAAAAWHVDHALNGGRSVI